MQASEDTPQPIQHPSVQPGEEHELASTEASLSSGGSVAETQPDDHGDQTADLTSPDASTLEPAVEIAGKIETQLPEAPPDDEDTAPLRLTQPPAAPPPFGGKSQTAPLPAKAAPQTAPQPVTPPSQTAKLPAQPATQPPAAHPPGESTTPTT